MSIRKAFFVFLFMKGMSGRLKGTVLLYYYYYYYENVTFVSLNHNIDIFVNRN
jgi:hypothetical protein